ncbi:M14 metallopeptidase family protein [Flavobacterium sp.]|uniref:M14 family metallopeptidase n=1 Tax=Flavobacterium sp. TaxID=239 RepID=UPI00263684B6|nr:M14 metallopeptidase family protein [Flavobacterium sp.]
MDYFECHKKYKQNQLFGRYITRSQIEDVMQSLNIVPIVKGYSVQNHPLYQLDVGKGKFKVLVWSQMHGNEGTTTKALFDFIAFLQSGEPLAVTLQQMFTFRILPMVNPDGAEAYSRVNANQVDLNRDACDLSQPESQFLRKAFDDFQPHLAYNLHDQRSIFGVGTTGKPATVSFLAPAFNEERSINEVRTKAMNLIVAMQNELQNFIPNQIGRFDDSFNLNCVGDCFTRLGVPTVLFEAGHYPNDYYREYTRKMIFIALLSGVKHIYENDIVDNKNELYLNIPQNNPVYYDFIYKNIKINYEGKEIITNFAAQYREELIEGKIEFNAYIVEVGLLEGKLGHSTFNAHKMKYSDDHLNIPNINQKADFCLENSIKFVNGLKI